MPGLGPEGGALKTHGVVAQAAGQEEPQRHRKWGGRGGAAGAVGWAPQAALWRLGVRRDENPQRDLGQRGREPMYIFINDQSGCTWRMDHREGRRKAGCWWRSWAVEGRAWPPVIRTSVLVCRRQVSEQRCAPGCFDVWVTAGKGSVSGEASRPQGSWELAQGTAWETGPRRGEARWCFEALTKTATGGCWG